MVLRVLISFLLVFAMAGPAFAGLSSAQRKQALNSSASKIIAKCNSSGSPYRKCFPHVSARQCRSALKSIVGPCKKETRRFLFSHGKSKEPASTLRKAVGVFMRMCSGGEYMKKMMRNKSVTKACLKKIRFQ